MVRTTRFVLSCLFLASTVWLAGCRGETATDSDDAPPMPPPEQPATPAPQPGDQSAFPTEGDPKGAPSARAAARESAESAQAAREPVELPTEGDPVGDPEVPGLATAPAGGAPQAVDQAPAGQTRAAKIEANLASLSIEDRERAQKQKICPVSGGPLGGMGPPEKIAVAGHEVFICCEGCEGKLKNDPEKYLAKIGLEPETDATLQ